MLLGGVVTVYAIFSNGVSALVGDTSDIIDGFTAELHPATPPNIIPKVTAAPVSITGAMRALGEIAAASGRFRAATSVGYTPGTGHAKSERLCDGPNSAHLAVRKTIRSNDPALARPVLTKSKARSISDLRAPSIRVQALGFMRASNGRLS